MSAYVPNTRNITISYDDTTFVYKGMWPTESNQAGKYAVSNDAYDSVSFTFPNQEPVDALYWFGVYPSKGSDYLIDVVGGTATVFRTSGRSEIDQSDTPSIMFTLTDISSSMKSITVKRAIPDSGIPGVANPEISVHHVVLQVVGELQGPNQAISNNDALSSNRGLNPQITPSTSPQKGSTMGPLASSTMISTPSSSSWSNAGSNNALITGFSDGNDDIVLPTIIDSGHVSTSSTPAALDPFTPHPSATVDSNSSNKRSSQTALPIVAGTLGTLIFIVLVALLWYIRALKMRRKDIDTSFLTNTDINIPPPFYKLKIMGKGSRDSCSKSIPSPSSSAFGYCWNNNTFSSPSLKLNWKEDESISNMQSSESQVSLSVFSEHSSSLESDAAEVEDTLYCDVPL